MKIKTSNPPLDYPDTLDTGIDGMPSQACECGHDKWVPMGHDLREVGCGVCGVIYLLPEPRPLACYNTTPPKATLAGHAKSFLKRRRANYDIAVQRYGKAAIATIFGERP